MINELFFENEEAFMFVEDIDDMNDLDDYMRGYHLISIVMTREILDDKQVLKICFGDLVDPDKLRVALDEYFNMPDSLT